MDLLLSNAAVHHSVPEKYVLPPAMRPAGHDELLADLPVVDLRGALGEDRRRVAAEIIRAGKEFGFFQVVNHGVGEIVTNGLLASVEHRAVTNSAAARMSVATLIMPRMDCRIAPAQELVSEGKSNAPKYRDFLFSEFMEAYAAAAANREGVLDVFKIKQDPQPELAMK